jgi:OmpA-OmpF porin, OOP family
MMPVRALRSLALALSPALMPGCVPSSLLDQQIDRLGQLLIDADQSGAMRCAPRELAIARSQLEFAQLEREQGYTSRAERHLQIAEQHAEAARLLSPSQHCAGRPVP